MPGSEDGVSDVDGSSLPDLPGGRPAKRRRLNDPQSGSESDDSCDDGDEATSSAAFDDDERRSRTSEKENEKPKSKYKIHIPKNPELPRDSFFTQPPERSSSPYRIDHFHWQKPKRPSPPPPSKPPISAQPTSRNSHVSTTSAPALEPRQSSSTTGIVPADFHRSGDDYDFDEGYDEMLADLPADAFATPMSIPNVTSKDPIPISSQEDCGSQPETQRMIAPLNNLRQTTLFGTQAPDSSSQTQSKRKHAWPLANREEPPTHHKLNREAMKTWVYPTNLGTVRQYQFSIAAKALYHNMLVALPTGLGKTFIAATVMLNWFRWTADAQIVFVAPTRPLVSQQVKACFEIVGIPRLTTSMLTGDTSPGLRAEEWQSKRVFFMTPQTIINDLKTGICDPKRLVLLVVDEAHRATGGYAYVEVVKFLRRFNTSFRVLALTATPGSSIESVQEVIDGLGISRIEIRTEESLDIRQYVHARKIETVLFDNSEEMAMVMGLFSKALQPLVDKLSGMNAYWGKDPMTLTPYGCTQARQRWMLDAGKRADHSIKSMVITIFSLLASLSHGIELLKFHGIGPFYHKVLAFRNEMHANGKKGGKYANQINTGEHFQTMMSRVQVWINSPDFIGHPKLEYLRRVVLNHFLDAGEGRGASDPSATRIMVFAHYRDSAEEIARVLKRDEPMIRPHVFVGQANSKGSEGMDQKKQLATVEKFKSGTYNVLVATCVGEEGLDIGEVDLIVCYDASASPIRMLQRMGRTGRKRAGNIVVTLMRGKEENNFVKAKDSYEKMQVEIASGAKFCFHDEESRRIVPKDVQPVVDQRVIEIPPENTQADLPEPKRRGRPPKRPPKKFHMPDGVRKGFVKASRLGGDEDSDDTDSSLDLPTKKAPRKKTRPSSPVLVPSLDEVLLTSAEEGIFERKYLDIKGDNSQIVEFPRLDAFPALQRRLRPTKYIGHSRLTKSAVRAFASMHTMDERKLQQYEGDLDPQDKDEGQAQADKRADFFSSLLQQSKPSRTSLGDPSPKPLSSPSALISKGNQRRSKKSYVIEPALDEELEEELDANDSLNDFFDDEPQPAVSSKSSPPPRRKSNEPFYRENPKALENASDSDDELPDINTLLGDEKDEMVGKERKRGRRVVDDSDEE